MRSAGVDIGGTKCLGVVVGAGGAVEHEHRIPTPRGGEAILDGLAAVVRALEARAGPVDAVGIGAAGLLGRNGVLHAAPNLHGVADLPVRQGLQDRLGRPVAVDNDATCATVAEWRAGAARGHDDAVLVTLGTGIGGGAVVGGRVVRGAHGFAGEPGHMVVVPDGPPCVCGMRGCWERYASGSGLARLAREAATGGRLDHVVALAGDDPEAVRGEHVTAAARAGDGEALAVLDEFAWWVALGLVNLTNLLDPSILVLGGGMIVEAPLLLAPVRRHLGHLLYAPTLRPHPQVAAAALGERAGAIGAALLALDDA